MMNCFFNHTPLPFSGFSYWKKGFFNILLSLLFFTSCSNHHCKDPMFAPLEIGFYSDADTLPISFSFLAIQGIDSEKYIDSIVNVSGTGKNSVQLPLKKFSESSKFLFLSAQNQPIEEYIFKEKRSNTGSLCPQNSDSISVYSNGENEFLLCNEIDRINEANNVIIVVNNDQLEEFFFRYKNQDTLRISRPTKDTLNINYTYTQEFVSAECGCLTTFELDEVQYTNHYINEAIISNKSVKSSIVNNPDDKHIKIYFKNY